jgi:hypothetical protein
VTSYDTESRHGFVRSGWCGLRAQPGDRAVTRDFRTADLGVLSRVQGSQPLTTLSQVPFEGNAAIRSYEFSRILLPKLYSRAVRQRRRGTMRSWVDIKRLRAVSTLARLS